MDVNPIRVLIVDDERLARDRLRELLAEREDFETVGECRNGVSAIEAIRSLQPDLVLLDVQMPELDGIGVLEALRPGEIPAVIFVTAYDQYALRAFELHALDYLLKPFDDERFEHAIGRARDDIRRGHLEGLSHRLTGLLRELASAPSDPGRASPPPVEDRMDRIAVRSGARWLIVEANDIDWIEGAGVYARLVVRDKSHLLRMSLTELENRLDPKHMVRIHRSTIVNMTRVKEVRPHTHGEYVLLLQDGTRLKVSRSYSDHIRGYLERIS